jgi:hypothetical protein
VQHQLWRVEVDLEESDLLFVLELAPRQLSPKISPQSGSLDLNAKGEGRYGQKIY